MNTNFITKQYTFPKWCIDAYWTAGDGENCPWGEVIGTEDQCKDAASQLGLEYNDIRTVLEYPAGCFVSFVDYNVYFNTEIDPSVNTPHSDTGGLSHTRQGRIFVYFILDTFV